MEMQDLIKTEAEYKQLKNVIVAPIYIDQQTIQNSRRQVETRLKRSPRQFLRERERRQSIDNDSGQDNVLFEAATFDKNQNRHEESLTRFKVFDTMNKTLQSYPSIDANSNRDQQNMSWLTHAHVHERKVLSGEISSTNVTLQNESNTAKTTAKDLSKGESRRSSDYN